VFGVPFDVWVTWQSSGITVLAVSFAVSQTNQLYKRSAVGFDRQVPAFAVRVFEALANASPEIVAWLRFTGVMVTL
jgi:hypothetical protein